MKVQRGIGPFRSREAEPATTFSVLDRINGKDVPESTGSDLTVVPDAIALAGTADVVSSEPEHSEIWARRRGSIAAAMCMHHERPEGLPAIPQHMTHSIMY